MDKKMLDKLMSKKKEGPALDPEYKKAKMGVLGSLKDEMGKLMGEDVRGVKKVTVAAADKAGLEKGLEKAEEMISGDEESEEAPEGEICPDCGEVHEEMGEEESDMSMDEIEAKIAELEALKNKKMKI